MSVWYTETKDGWHVGPSRYLKERTYGGHISPGGQVSAWEAQSGDRTVIYVQNDALFIFGGSIPLAVIDRLRELEKRSAEPRAESGQ